MESIIGHYGQQLLPGVIQKININDGEIYDINMLESNTVIDVDNSWCDSERGGYNGINDFLQSTIEVKYHMSAVKYNSLFIEYTTYFEKEDEIRFSGIHVSEADKWWFEMDGVSIIINGSFLKWLYTNRTTLNFDEKPSHDQSHQSTGFIVPIGLILPLLEQYNQERNRNRIKEVYLNRTKNG